MNLAVFLFLGYKFRYPCPIKGYEGPIVAYSIFETDSRSSFYLSRWIGDSWSGLYELGAYA